MDIHDITLKRQIDFNNQWPKIKSLELESVEKFGQKLSDCKLEQLLVPMHWDEDKTFALFTRSHALAKIFSSTLDMYEVLHSPLKSSLADLATYYEYYFLLIYTYFLWGIVMFKIQQLEGEHEALTVSAMCDSISNSLSNLAILPNK